MAAESRRSVPGGYSRNSFNFGPHAVFVTKGEGAYIETVDGHRLLDLNNNYTVNVLGHDHPALTSALVEAIPAGVSFGNPGAQEGELARMLIERIPSVEKVQFSCSATESCMTAVRLARATTGRTRIAKFEGGYHGFSDVLQISAHPTPENGGSPEAPVAVPDSGGIPAATTDQVLVLTQNDLPGTEALLRAHGGELACLIMELQSGAGGMVALDQDFVQMLRDVTRELGIVLIFDETISLRAGYQGLQGLYGITPDLTVMGKIIGGGLPLGAVGGSAEIMNALEDGRVSVSGTHHGHKLSVVAGAACLGELTEDAYATLNGHAQRIAAELNEWSQARNSPFRIHGRGFSHLGYAYMTSPGEAVRTHRDYWRIVDGDTTQTISLELANRGYFPVHRGEMSLSLAMTAQDITGLIETLKSIVRDIESEGAMTADLPVAQTV
ncbi:aminotransferase class III-fold pyridoxal phosphate-dependent enzyme (plasmid) [Citricoccus sp. SGAir0253]|nr:aminotransferase class III-fold pyridoxal phosphate-dependent enzyme [Citricoccus sp. SGAir0253]